jgi:uncharacterized protein (TIGR02217 family)
MAFYEIQFPSNFSYGAHGGYGWLTHVVSTQAAYEYRSPQWAMMRGRWNVGHNLRQPTDYQTLMMFFVSMQGRVNAWRFKDWNDFTDWGVGTFQTNPNNQLQLCKTYTAPSPVTGSSQPTFQRWISKPVPGTLTLPGGVTVDYTTGIVTGGSLGGVWTGQFDVPCRFDTDSLDSQVEQPSGTAGEAVASTWDNIPVVEIRITPGGSGN